MFDSIDILWGIPTDLREPHKRIKTIRNECEWKQKTCSLQQTQDMEMDYCVWLHLDRRGLPVTYLNLWGIVKTDMN